MKTKEGWEDFSNDYLNGFREALCSWLFQLDATPKAKWTKKETRVKLLEALRDISGVMKERGFDY